MANKGETKCLKINKTFAISGINKTQRYVYRPSPGKHNSKAVVTVGYILKELLKLADNSREVKYILKNREILVDNKKVKDYKFPVGFYDIIEIPKLNKFYKLVYSTNGAYKLEEIEKENAKFKICKIISKNIVKKGNVQLVTNDGRVIITNNLAYKPKASIKIDLEENTIKEYFPLEKDREVFVIGGKHIGQKAKIVDIISGTMKTPTLIKLNASGIDFETTEKNIIVIN
jgi:small subunit ribosomal protein S4e